MSPSKLVLRSAVVSSLLGCGFAHAQTPPATANVTVNTTTRFQTIEGFGTALGSDSPVWTTSLQQLYTKDLGASILRVPLTPDIVPSQITFGPDVQSNINLMNFYGNYPQSNWGGFAQYVTANKIDQMKVIASIWTPPPWMKTNNSQYGGSLIQTPDNLQQFARYAAAYVTGFQQAYGVQLYALSLQNELRFSEPYPSAVYTPSQYVAVVDAVGAEFAKDGIKTKLFGPEDVGVDSGFLTQQQMGFINAINADPAAKNFLGFYAVHGYAGNGTQTGGGAANWANYSAQIKAIGDGKQSWMTEESGENPAWVHFDSQGNPDGGLSVALNIHEGLAYGNLNSWVLWQTDDGYGKVTNFTLEENGDATSLKYNAAKHYFKFIRPGSVRVAATPDNLTGVSVDAYVNDANHTVTIELINSSTTDTQTTISIPATNVATFAEYLTDATQPWAVLSDLTVANGTVSLMVPANSVITLQSDSLATSLPEPASALVVIPVAALLLRRSRA